MGLGGGMGPVEGLSQNQLDRQRESHNPFSKTYGGGGGQVGGGRSLNPANSKYNNMYPQEEEGGAGKLSLQARRKSVAGKWIR
jgi:hypothetical protein